MKSTIVATQIEQKKIIIDTTKKQLTAFKQAIQVWSPYILTTAITGAPCILYMHAQHTLYCAHSKCYVHKTHII